MKTLLLTILALGHAQAHAGYCESAEAIEERITLCEENEQFAQAAETCKIAYVKAVKAEQEKLGRELRKGAKKAGMQRESEAISASSYQTTIGRLDALIARGEASRAESRAYIAHFLPPFHWPASLGPMPKRGDPALWDAYDGEFCFGEHRETIDHMVKDFDKAIADLRAAREEALHLKGSSTANQKGLDGGSATRTVSSTRAQSAKAAPKAGGRSTITGVEQDRKKRLPR